MYNSTKTATRIKELAKSKGIKISEIMTACELNINTLSSMSNRGSWVQANSLAKIADYLDCSVDYLLCRTDDPAGSADTYTFGDNNGIQAVNNSSVSVGTTQKTKQSEDIVEEFMQRFSELNLDDKVEVMNFTLQKTKKGA